MSRARRWFRRGPGSAYRAAQSIRFLVTRDRRAVGAFLRPRGAGGIPYSRRLALLVSFLRCTNAVRGYHSLEEMLTVATYVLERRASPGLTVVECGTGKGASTAKLSVAVREAGGRLVAFDSFRGIPANDERHVSLDGRPLAFRRGAFAATLPSVRRTLDRYGAPEVCRLVKGWFEDTLPRFDDPIDVVLLDVDLLASTRTCLRHLAPRVRPGGVVLTHDGHIRAIAGLLDDASFWIDEVGVPPPRIVRPPGGKLVAMSFHRPTVSAASREAPPLAELRP